jgi:hypothetical protein
VLSISIGKRREGWITVYNNNENEERRVENDGKICFGGVLIGLYYL